MMEVSLVQRNRRRATGSSAAGFTYGEVLVAAAVLSFIGTGVLALTGSVSRNSVRHAARTDMDADSRLAIDEVLLHLRGADQVMDSATLAGRSYTTRADGSEVVVRVPSFDPASRVFLSNTFDKIAIRHDAVNRRLLYTVEPGSSPATSTRIARTEKVLARDVSAAEFTYRINDSFRITSGGTDSTSVFSATLNLRFTPSGPPSVFVNGAPPAAGAVTAAAGSRSVMVNGVRRGDDVQVRYAVNMGGADRALVLPKVAEVDVRLTMSREGRPGSTVAQVLEGGARLRNQRN
jgi:hypothetical protein